MSYIRVVVILCLLFVPQLSIAEETTNEVTQADRIEERFAELSEELNLNEQQKKDVEPILRSQASQMHTLIEPHRGQFDSMTRAEKFNLGKSLRGLRSETQKKLKSHLSDDQLEKWEDLQNKRRDEMRAALKERRL